MAITSPTKNFSDAGLDCGFLVSEPANNRIAREQGMAAARVAVTPPGTIHGKVTAGAITTAAKTGGNTGNGAIVMDATNPRQDGVVPGVYTVRFTAANAYNVEKPNGDMIGQGQTGQTFSDDIKFVVNAGGTAFVVGDGFDITVADGSGVRAPLDLTKLDGGQVADSLNLFALPIAAAATRAAFLTGPGVEVNGNLINFPVGATQQQKATITQQLAARGIKVRY